MSMVFDFFVILPTDEGPTKFCNHSMVSFPCFEVKSTPDTFFGRPEVTNNLKKMSPMLDLRIGAFQPFIVFLYDLYGSLSVIIILTKGAQTLMALRSDPPSG